MELMVTTLVFTFFIGLLFLLFDRGSRAVVSANARQQAELSLNKAHFLLQRDLQHADPAHLRHKRVPLPGNGDAIWFLSAEDPHESDPDKRFVRSAENGAPVFQSQILYYLIRPSNYSEVSGGMPAAVDPDPNSDFFAPHKFLVRKVIEVPGKSQKLLTDMQIDDYITPPTDYSLSPFKTEPNVVDFRLVSDKLLSFEALLDQSVLEVRTSALRIDEARKSVPVGNLSLRDHPLTVHRTVRYELRN